MSVHSNAWDEYIYVLLLISLYRFNHYYDSVVGTTKVKYVLNFLNIYL